MVTEFTKNNLNKQGFGNLDENAKSCYAGPLRFAPGVGTVLIIVGLTLQSPAFLGIGAIVPLSGALFPRGMILDLAYNLGVRHLFHGPALPPSPTPRRFSYLLSTVLLAGSALSFYYGFSTVGIILGGAVALGGLMLTTTHWCLGSWIYRLFFRHSVARSKRHPVGRARPVGRVRPDHPQRGIPSMGTPHFE
ncbi:hypothetical protein RCH23_003116 [Cryobacterium sp. CAN_C3]|nr:hypothetical protein [Cryobacterium sp. CAN_C3]